jgi:hypothetical protein
LRLLKQRVGTQATQFVFAACNIDVVAFNDVI